MSIFEERESSIRAYSRMFPVVFSSAKNARQTDENGKEYIDFFAGAGVLNFGHNNERMIQAMIDYMQKDGVLHSLDMQTSAKANFMQRFTDVILAPRNMPHRMQFMGPTGTNAVEAATAGLPPTGFRLRPPRIFFQLAIIDLSRWKLSE